VLSFFMLMALLAPGPSDDRVIDLTNLPKTVRRFIPTSRSGHVTVSGSFDGPVPAEPLSLTLLSAEVDHQQIVYEVKLTNNSVQPECVPEDPDISGVEPQTPQPYSYTGATLSLTIDSGDGATRTLEPVTIVDDMGHHHCEALLPKESLIVRAKANLDSAAEPRSPATGKLTVRAAWLIFAAHVSIAQGQISEETAITQRVASVNELTICAAICK
jgi:hypothetical protein